MTIDKAISHEERNVEINKLIGEVSDCEPTNAIDYHRQLVEWLKELKQLREQEPCENAISRDELLKAMDTWDKFGYTETGCFVREPKNDCVKYIHYDDVIKCIKGMPPVTPQQSCEDIAKAFQLGMALGFGEKYDEMDKVMEEVKKPVTPQPKTGHWVRWYEIIEKEYCTIHEPHCKCSECNREYEPYIASLFNYCPNCGARMFEQRESEEV